MSGEARLVPPRAAAPGAGAPRICVGIATRGRAGVLAASVARLAAQSLPPASLIVSCTDPADAAGLPAVPNLQVLTGPAGTCRQRNAILEAMPADTDIVAFFDDDFVPHRDWLAAVARAFADHPRVGAITGFVLADGIKGAGLSFEEACGIADRAAPSSADAARLEPWSPYGCNMAFRREAVAGLRFDERLVLYGWLEDRDLGGRIREHGWSLVRLAAAQGVHMGVKLGRTAGLRLGYSQVMNPFYMLRKGTISRGGLADHVLRNLAANLAGALRPEPFIDRRGRLKGNVLALLDLCRGRLTPERAEQL